MKDGQFLGKILGRIHGRGYKAYQDLRGSYQFKHFILHVEHVQRDPYATPSLLRVEVEDHHFPSHFFNSTIRRVALEDYLARSFQKAIHAHPATILGSGRSGDFRIDAGGQEILERSCVNLGPENVEMRFSLGLPARGRRIMGKEAKHLLVDILPLMVDESCFYTGDPEVEAHLNLTEDAHALREQLSERGLVAFLAEGSTLPRRSGVCSQPLKTAVPLKSPSSLRVSLSTPNRGMVTGMGIPEGVTLIVGGGYHGKSTLLQALEAGIYNHVPGDGRELVVTRESAVKIRAEDGRSIQKTDISSFIHEPPFMESTREFSTQNASGSTSQAANIVEALEAGSHLLLFDEDTSATNFMIRDERMQVLVKSHQEPITPFIDRVLELYEEEGVSTVMVMGGSGDYFEVAHTVVMMDRYQPQNRTREARMVAQQIPTGRSREVPHPFSYHHRTPLRESINPYRGRKIKISSRGKDTILLGSDTIDLSQVKQLVDPSQTRALAYALYHAQHYMDNQHTILEILHLVETDMEKSGLDVLSPPGRSKPPGLARFRPYEFAAALNRLRSLSIQ
ncbi:ATPase [Methanobacterium sp. CWC-01]|uniref:ABC-ATPase domain-containing protein n=1 Tax=Methanobacterium aridiramus TaxID=2584467 RepID=UPI002575817E|nr:ABC-ATPase domain-containing protein [Methanobacterium sp. CWC-01]WJI08625.1 ATPase [Methanobacterium sp. CWC-01]